MAVAITRRELSAGDLRREAARRMLAIAFVLVRGRPARAHGGQAARQACVPTLVRAPAAPWKRPRGAPGAADLGPGHRALYGFAQAYTRYVRPLAGEELDRRCAEDAPASEEAMRALVAAVRPRLEPSPVLSEFLRTVRGAPVFPAPPAPRAAPARPRRRRPHPGLGAAPPRASPRSGAVRHRARPNHGGRPEGGGNRLRSTVRAGRTRPARPGPRPSPDSAAAPPSPWRCNGASPRKGAASAGARRPRRRASG